MGGLWVDEHFAVYTTPSFHQCGSGGITVIGRGRKWVLKDRCTQFRTMGDVFSLSEILGCPIFSVFSCSRGFLFYPIDCVGVTLPRDMCCPTEILSALEMEFTYLRTVSGISLKKT